MKTRFLQFLSFNQSVFVVPMLGVVPILGVVTTLGSCAPAVKLPEEAPSKKSEKDSRKDYQQELVSDEPQASSNPDITFSRHTHFDEAKNLKDPQCDDTCSMDQNFNSTRQEINKIRLLQPRIRKSPLDCIRSPSQVDQSVVLDQDVLYYPELLSRDYYFIWDKNILEKIKTNVFGKKDLIERVEFSYSIQNGFNNSRKVCYREKGDYYPNLERWVISIENLLKSAEEAYIKKFSIDYKHILEVQFHFQVQSTYTIRIFFNIII